MLAMRAVPYPLTPGASYYDYPLSMAAMYRGVPFQLPQFSPALLLNQGTRQPETGTSVDSLLPTVSNASVGAAASTGPEQGTAHQSPVTSAPQTAIKNELLLSSAITPGATEFEPYNLGLVSPPGSKSLDPALFLEKPKDTKLKTEGEVVPETEENQPRGLPPLHLIHLRRGQLLNQYRGEGVNLRSYTITEEEYAKMEGDTLSQKKMPTTENASSQTKPVTCSAFQSASQYSGPGPAVAENPFQALALPAHVDNQLCQPHSAFSQNMKKLNEAWLSNATSSHSYTSELPHQGAPIVCQGDTQTLAGPSFRESCSDVREKLLPSLYNNAFFSGYTPSGSIFYASPCDRLPSATTQTLANINSSTRVVPNSTTTASLSSASSVSSSPPASSPFPSTTTSAAVSSSASISTALVNPMTLLAETEECDDDGFPIVDDTDESEFSALDLAMLGDH